MGGTSAAAQSRRLAFMGTMGTRTSPFIEGLVEEEIRRLVAEAIAKHGMVSTAECAERIRHVYPTCGLSDRNLANRVMMAAAAAGVAVEIGKSNSGAGEALPLRLVS